MTGRITRITPAEAKALQAAGAPLLDVRDAEEHALGMAAGARAAPRARLEASPLEFVADQAAALLLVCGSGKRSYLAAEALAAQGFTRLYSIEGGMAAWGAAGLPMAPAGEDADFMDRYSRHLLLPQVGLAGQRRLAASRVLLVGAGGLGSPAAYYLAAAGVGSLRIVDDDRVERSNLQRQILHRESGIGAPKVASASEALQALNPRTRIEPVDARLGADNVVALLEGVDVVLDGADNFPTRYLLSDACVALAKPLVYGAVHRFEGQVSVFDAGRQRGVAPCYRCLFPDAPRPEDAPNCAEAGVLGVLPGIIGLLQATEALKLLLGIGEPLVGRLLHVEALGMRFRETRLRPDPSCRACAAGASPMPGPVQGPGCSAPGGSART
jgi:molybdopterin/thiamine biosynthesis adenylyltransferase/rhodanese-related sulfurtransferase